MAESKAASKPQESKAKAAEESRAVWVAVAHAEDGDGVADFAVFSSELQALRFAIQRDMAVVRWPFGQAWSDVVADVRGKAVSRG